MHIQVSTLKGTWAPFDAARGSGSMKLPQASSWQQRVF